ncbi:hypothetical protein [Anianabacter salinae]|uniref:hypothetical protein n=1 Tax=Anianabacter salinae TaxID=2851023 RepID=UPI00225DE5A7|nr:hypothetical protein [Anianabacter salinae]MBV0911697.1 hypothetical protein [Anianabacter salinae]
MTITNITCNNPCSGIQDDDVFLLIQADGGPPARYPAVGTYSMGAGTQWTLEGGYEVDYDYGVIVTAWDRDSYMLKNLDSPDYLFNINVKGNTTSSTNTKTNHNGADYTFTRNISS